MRKMQTTFFRDADGAECASFHRRLRHGTTSMPVLLLNLALNPSTPDVLKTALFVLFSRGTEILRFCFSSDVPNLFFGRFVLFLTQL